LESDGWITVHGSADAEHRDRSASLNVQACVLQRSGSARWTSGKIRPAERYLPEHLRVGELADDHTTYWSKERIWEDSGQQALYARCDSPIEDLPSLETFVPPDLRPSTVALYDSGLAFGHANGGIYARLRWWHNGSALEIRSDVLMAWLRRHSAAIGFDVYHYRDVGDRTERIISADTMERAHYSFRVVLSASGWNECVRLPEDR
jgi:hypothetical protein